MPDFLSAGQQLRSTCGRARPGELQADATSVHVAARAHALHDFLANVAALRMTNVARFERSLVRDVFVVEVVAKPGNAALEAKAIQRCIADRPAAECAHRRQQRRPEAGKMLAQGNQFDAGSAEERLAQGATWHLGDERLGVAAGCD